jgi:hypothetical protein
MTPEEILAEWAVRKAAMHPVIEQMRQVRDAYNADLVVPLPEMDRQEKAAVANYVSMGLDQTAMRIASTTPSMFFPPLDPGNSASEKRASNRRYATQGWWDANKIGLKMRRRARHFIGYASSPVVLRPDWKLGCARWEVRDPLSTYPGMTGDPDEITPPNVIFGYQRTYAWLKQKYPNQLAALEVGDNPSPSDRFDVVEWVDEEETVLLVCGTEAPAARSYGSNRVNGSPHQLLERIHNRTGLCLAVVPGRITLDRPMGQFDATLGILQTQAKLMALDLIATEKAVFPDTYLISRPGETAKFIAGPYEGRTGLINIVQGGEIRDVPLNPGFQTGPMMDRLERAQRITTATPAEFGGESQTNVRTGKRGDAILSAVVDFPVQEAQEVFAESLREENRRAIAIAKSYFGNQKKTFYVGPTKKRVDYTPSKDFETDENIVTYPHPGADINGLIVGIGQRIGVGMMSKRTGMEIDPMVDDPEREHDRVVFESLEQAALSSVQQQAASGALPLTDIAYIMDQVVRNKMDLVEAIQAAQKAAQARQAQQAPPTAPEAQPGLSLPGMGAEAGGAIPPPTSDVQNLSSMLGALRRPVSAAQAA